MLILGQAVAVIKVFGMFYVCVCTDVEVDVDELNQEQVLDINKMATTYGMAEGDFVRYGRKKKHEIIFFNITPNS